ncbi:MAG: hypothetical protein ACJ761_08920 [Chloroflexota bacterium]
MVVVDAGVASPAHGDLDRALRGLQEDDTQGAFPWPPDDDRIGIVFVHGIGNQKPGETLLRWARPLLRVVGSWSRQQAGAGRFDVVDWAGIDFTGATLPYLEATVPAGEGRRAQTWVLTEAWWAAQILPPTIGDMADWLFRRGELTRMISGITSGFAAVMGGPFPTLERLFVPVFLRFVATPILFGFFLLTRLVELIPIETLRDALRARQIELFLVDWFGDVRTMLIDRPQAANVRGRVREAIRAVRAYGCGSIVVVAESGGTFVSYATLVESTEADVPVDRLITHGQALALAWNLGQACDVPIAGVEAVDPERLQPGDALLRDLNRQRPALRWNDFWATHDPATAGGFANTSCVVAAPMPPDGTSTMVFNRMSIRRDHTAYWDNIEGFVLPVARLIDETSPDGRPSRFYSAEHATEIERRREGRVRLLGLPWTGYTTAVVVGLLAAIAGPWVDATLRRSSSSVIDIGRVVHPVLAWAGQPLAALNDLILVIQLSSTLSPAGYGLVGLAVLGLAFWAVERLMVSSWDRWDEADAARSLLETSTWPSLQPLQLQLWACVLAAILLVVFGVTAWWPLFVAAVVVGVATNVWSRRTGR